MIPPQNVMMVKMPSAKLMIECLLVGEGEVASFVSIKYVALRHECCGTLLKQNRPSSRTVLLSTVGARGFEPPTSWCAHYIVKLVAFLF